MYAEWLVCRWGSNVGPYLDEIRDEIEITYPQDIVGIIAEQKKNATAESNSANTQSEVTPEPALPPVNLLSARNSTPSSAPFSFNPPDNSSALGK